MLDYLVIINKGYLRNPPLKVEGITSDRFILKCVFILYMIIVVYGKVNNSVWIIPKKETTERLPGMLTKKSVVKVLSRRL